MSEFGLLLVLEIPALRRYALKLTRDKVQAEDLLQSCLLHALVKQGLWRPGTDLRRWLFTMLYHQWINELRRRTRESDNLCDAGKALAPEPGPDPVARILVREIDRAIAGLPEIRREVLRSIALDDMPYPEVAAVFHLSLGTVRSRLSRARRKSRSILLSAFCRSADGRSMGGLRKKEPCMTEIEPRHATPQLGPGLYAQWRSSDIGVITERLERALILELADGTADKSVLDVGCGDGDLALDLWRHGAQVSGLDASPGMIKTARDRARQQSAEIVFAAGRAERLPYAVASFDLVTAVAVLCFIADAALVFCEFARVLRPGGRLVLGELGRWSTWAAARRIRAWRGSELWRTARFRTARELCHLAEATGFEVNAVRGAVYYPRSVTAAHLLGRPWPADNARRRLYSSVRNKARWRPTRFAPRLTWIKAPIRTCRQERCMDGKREHENYWLLAIFAGITAVMLIEPLPVQPASIKTIPYSEFQRRKPQSSNAGWESGSCTIERLAAVFTAPRRSTPAEDVCAILRSRDVETAHGSALSVGRPRL